MSTRSSRSVQVVDGFAPETAALRAIFDERFAEPRSTRGDRFQWDYWHVPGQYTALRTPAWTYFPRSIYRAMHERLVTWGRAHLGCHDISPPWLSCYVEGCRQELHGDLPHGPFAFVLSLTHWQRRTFRGGETLLLRDEVLDFWHDFASVRSVEEGELIRAVEPKFGRLVVFDPRIPHGVRTVTGTHDPREGRLVLHGWFVQPRPLVTGPLSVKALSARIGELMTSIGALVGDLPVAGLASFGFGVDRRGRMTNLKLLADTTRVPAGDEEARQRFVRAVKAELARWTFGAQRAPSSVTLPLVFERG